MRGKRKMKYHCYRKKLGSLCRCSMLLIDVSSVLTTSASVSETGYERAFECVGFSVTHLKQAPSEVGRYVGMRGRLMHARFLSVCGRNPNDK